MTNRQRLRHLWFWGTFVVATLALMLAIVLPTRHWPRILGIAALVAASLLFSVWFRSRHSFLWSLTFWFRWCRFRRIPPGHCRACGYNLTGNSSGRCPECGGAFNVAPP